MKFAQECIMYRARSEGARNQCAFLSLATNPQILARLLIKSSMTSPSSKLRDTSRQHGTIRLCAFVPIPSCANLINRLCRIGRDTVIALVLVGRPRIDSLRSLGNAGRNNVPKRRQAIRLQWYRHVRVMVDHRAAIVDIGSRPAIDSP